MVILLVIGIILFVFWLLGATTRFTESKVLHLALVIAIILIVIWLLREVFRAF